MDKRGKLTIKIFNNTGVITIQGGEIYMQDTALNLVNWAKQISDQPCGFGSDNIPGPDDETTVCNHHSM